MKTRVMSVNPTQPEPEAIREASQVLARGGLVAFPTDTLYALGANALDPRAIERVLTVKGRHHGKPLSVLLPSAGLAAELAAELPDAVRALLEAFWPGPLTVVLRASSKVPPVLTAATGTVGLRVPAGALAQSLLTTFGGPIIGTSANKSGGADPGDARAVQKAVGGQIDLILDGGRVALGIPSTVIDCTGAPARILREGAVPRSELARAIALA
jgi:L-threonylcarbamoyladenylate synthase